MEKGGWVYVVASKTMVIYVGVTNDIGRRPWEHREHLVEGFTKRYNCERLIYMEHYQTIEDAIAREKQLKKWRREKKLWLIQQTKARPLRRAQWRDRAAASTRYRRHYRARGARSLHCASRKSGSLRFGMTY